MNENEAKCRADLDVALAALKKSNRLLMQSMAAGNMLAVEKHSVKLRASRWRFAEALRNFENMATDH
jgi:hypothetical protein